MNHLTTERLEIIKQFKSISILGAQTFEKRLKRAKTWGTINFYLANFILIIVISASALLGIEPFRQSWSKSGLTILIAFSISLSAHFSLIEYYLLKHLKALNNGNFTFNQKLNSELKKLINDLNFHRFKPFWIIFPTIFVILAGALVVFELNPFWDIFVWPVLIIGILLSWRLNSAVYQIRKNLEQTEIFDIYN